MLAREGTLRCLEKGQQQGIFTLAQRDRYSLGIYESSAAAFKLPAVESVSTAFRIAESRDAAHFLSAQNRLDPCEQFSQREGFDNVIIGTELKADDAVAFVEARAGYDDYRHIGMGPNFPQKIEAVVVAKPQIKNDQTGVPSCEVAIKFTAIRRSTRREILFDEVIGNHASNRLVIIDNDNVTLFA